MRSKRFLIEEGPRLPLRLPGIGWQRTAELQSDPVGASTVITWSGCGECGYAGHWPDDTTRCPECAERGSEDEQKLQLQLTDRKITLGLRPPSGKWALVL
jgi:hypothetical protein